MRTVFEKLATILFVCALGLAALAWAAGADAKTIMIVAMVAAIPAAIVHPDI